jgi:hypothetical protein
LSHQIHNISVLNAIVAWVTLYMLGRTWLEGRGARRHLQLLVTPHVFRYLGLVALAPHLFDMRSLGFGDGYHALVGYGDWTSGLLALAALWLLERDSSIALPVVWVFNTVGLADFLNAGLRLAPSLTSPALIGDLGWVLFTIYLPMLLVSHLAIYRVLWQLRGGRLTLAHAAAVRP